MNRQQLLRQAATLPLAGAATAFGAARAQAVTLRFGHAHPEADSQPQAVVQFANRAKARTNGDV